jgi:hypothetical protein
MGNRWVTMGNRGVTLHHRLCRPRPLRPESVLGLAVHRVERRSCWSQGRSDGCARLRGASGAVCASVSLP